ncbi:WxcM-like domain-containing protein [uncultured Sphingobacterium sp.]|uniref:WxcM-like domain-containing protein n=1 Tax=uncultured Sphingobacterium sp. TaxID=182688 RepID=UPI00374A14BE
MMDFDRIKGGVAKDHRGEIRFFNTFDMTEVKRFYIIKNADVDLIRGWRGHRIEQRWFYILKGSFVFHLIKINEWEEPDKHLPIQQQILANDEIQILYVPAGYATAFQATDPDSELMVFADYPLSHASFDDYTWSLDYFVNLEIKLYTIENDRQTSK